MDIPEAEKGETMTPRNLADLPDVLTVPEACSVLRLGRNAMYEVIRTGEIPSLRIGRRILIPKRVLERFIDQRATQPDP